jgi:C-terminal processing protease CtpA/Prc
MILPMKIAICGLLCAAGLWAQTPELANELNFESGSLRDWGAGPTAKLDSETVHGGKWAVRITRTASDTGGFSGIGRSLPMEFTGSRIEMRGFIKTEDVSGFVGMWMREDGDAGVAAFDNMQSRQLKGTHDWAQYSILLPVNAEGRRLVFGVFVAGTGTAWVDDLELLVDGKPVWEAPKAARVKTPLDTDHEFDSGSGIALDKLAPAQVENLVTLGKVWGLLKYHHPAVTGGTRQWDYDLFRAMPAVLAAVDRAAANEAMAKWAAGLGELKKCDPCAELKPEGLQMRPDVRWIEDEARLGPELSKLLRTAYANRPANGKQFYVGKMPKVGNPDFQHEAAYMSATPGDAGMQILAAYRYWNIVQYWFPDREMIGADWTAVLRDTLPKIALSKSAGDYHRELMALIAQAHDTHSNLWSSIQDRPPVGPCAIGATIRYIEGQWVIADAQGGPPALLRRGDVLTALDGAPLAKQVEEWKRYYADSNEAAMQRDMARQITRGPCGETTAKVRREGEEIEVKTSRVSPPPPAPDYHDLPGDAFRKLGNDVAYLKISGLKKADVVRDIDLAAGTKGLIVDLRDYPSDFPLFDLGQLLVTEPTPFVHFTSAELDNPGAFRWAEEISLKPQQPHYAGKVVILVDEVTQSSAEYHAMAFRRAPGAKVVGSTTAGADGNVSQFALPGGLRSMVSGLGVFYPDRKPTQRVGIVPDVGKRPTVAGIKAGRDEVLEEGLRLILGRAVTADEVAKMLGK